MNRPGQRKCALRLAGCTEWATTKDHIIPKARGGKHLRNNTRPACEPCNQRKGCRLDSELGIRDFEPGDHRAVMLIRESRLAS